MRAWKTGATNSDFVNVGITSSDIVWCLMSGPHREAYLVITPAGSAVWLVEKRGYYNSNIVSVLSQLPSSSSSGGVMLTAANTLSMVSITDANNQLTDVLQTYNVKNYA